MTAVQKVIKYIATAFAAFLIVAIISAILSGIFCLLSALNLINSNVTEDLKIISSEVKEVSTLKLELAFTNLEIKTGDSFKVETNNSKISFTDNNGNIEIKEENHNWFMNNNYTSNLIVYIPEDMKILNEVKIETGAGKVKIYKLETQKLFLALGAGDVYIENLIATEKFKIDGGAGKTEINSCEINNLDANLGVGEFVFNGKLTEKNEIDSGVGAININLLDKEDNYTIDISKGLGSVTLNGKKLETDGVYGTGNNYLDIDGGVGEIKINFN